ncbi:MAG: tetratricopeptide repeat protein [Verrucomicrobia bacterium]|nr:tetratricopeptide repeat protein [Verrucomicrobiota bacterium]
MKPVRIPSPTSLNQPSPSCLWEPARLFLAGLGGLLALLVSSSFLDEYEGGQFFEFLKGQVGFGGMWESALFWKMALGFLTGAAAGYFLFLEIPISWHKRTNALALALALFLLPVVVYIPAMSAGFLWDDDQEITSNPSLLHLFPDRARPAEYKTNWRGLWEIWTGGITSEKDSAEGRLALGKPEAPWLVRLLRPPLCAIERSLFATEKNYRFDGNQSADYFPLKTTMLWVEYQLWGHSYDRVGRPYPIGPPFHIINILIHALDGLLLWMVLRQLKVPGAWLGSLLFVLHPVHAESVAWIAERKNTLSLCFCLLSMLAWLRFEVSENRKDYLWALGLFLGALLCKTHVVVFPAVLLLVAWWKTGTLGLREVRRTVPFFVLALAMSWMTVWFQNDRAIGGEVIPIGNFASRLAGAGVVTWAYLSKAILPINLSTIYANTPWLWWPLKDPQWWMFLTVALVPMTLLMLLAIRELYPFRTPIASRTPFFVFAYFVGTLFPVLGFFTMSYMRLTLQADHFQYFSDISIVAVAGASISILYEKSRGAWRRGLVGSCVLLVFSLSAYTWERAGVHRSEKTLWSACLEKNEASWQAHNHIGAVLYGEQKFEEAAPHFARAVQLKPENPEVHNNLGLVLWRYGHREEAIAQYREAVRIKGEVMALRGNLAGALMEMKRYDEAAEQYRIMIKEMPKDPGLHTNMGFLYLQTKHLNEAKQEFETALRLDPTNPAMKQNYDLLRRLSP